LRYQAEYDKILQQRLSEQYQSFVRYSQDNIHRQHVQSSHAADYIS